MTAYTKNNLVSWYNDKKQLLGAVRALSFNTQ